MRRGFIQGTKHEVCGKGHSRNLSHIFSFQAVELIHDKDCVHFYPVSTMVNKVQNKSEECIKPVDLRYLKFTDISNWNSTFILQIKGRLGTMACLVYLCSY